MNGVLGYCIGAFVGIVVAYSTLGYKEIDFINTVCANNNGIDKVLVDIFKVRVTCQDGAIFTLKN